MRREPSRRCRFAAPCAPGWSTGSGDDDDEEDDEDEDNDENDDIDKDTEKEEDDDEDDAGDDAEKMLSGEVKERPGPAHPLLRRDESSLALSAT